MTSRPRVMWRASSDCAEKPKVTVAMSPLNAAPDMKGTNSRLVSTYSNENEMAVRNSNGPAVRASSKNDLGTERNHTRSCIWAKSCKPLKCLL
ncbi:hypothetical protein D3C76_1101680 [compost metagenome]